MPQWLCGCTSDLTELPWLLLGTLLLLVVVLVQVLVGDTAASCLVTPDCFVPRILSCCQLRGAGLQLVVERLWDFRHRHERVS